MPAPAISTPTKYTARGSTDFYWLTATANYLSPTRAELNAGTSLKNVINASSGWSVTTGQIDVPVLADRFTATIPGAITAEASTLTVVASKTGTDARQLMPRDAAGFIVILHGGDVAGQKMDIWPVTVGSVSKQISVGGDAADMLVFSFSPTNVPASDVTIPA